MHADAIFDKSIKTFLITEINRHLFRRYQGEMAFINTKRGPNFSLREVEKLIQLVELHRNVINNKGTDSVTNA